MKKLLTVVGTRPNFIKVTQFARLLDRADLGLTHRLLHTGQHHDDKMARVFFEQFNMMPDFFLNIEGGSANAQISQIILGLENILCNVYKADMVLVVGDVTSTLAAAICANKLGIPVAHIESGLRSSDRTMPEEINRIVADDIADYCFVTEQSGLDNLHKMGKPSDQVFFVGNTMIDTLVAFEDAIQASTILTSLKLRGGDFALMTMHRPATVDYQDGLKWLVQVIKKITTTRPLVFPIHPRTRNNLIRFGLQSEFEAIPDVIFTDPLDYFSFQKLTASARYVITDSGGVQEETTFRQIPCITLRPSTERPVTVTLGSNVLAPTDLTEIAALIDQIEAGDFKKSVIPPLWDGAATVRISEVLFQLFSKL
ncbi:MAG: UDP-N-acetylglucosamine 2-epimerase (non-hydrolyzing) [Bacteroidia bacterium]|nr:UDP-N-acetylglucosamine 2-epimerase (non-hydrolyzing) [Bacteroidia bacterium]